MTYVIDILDNDEEVSGLIDEWRDDLTP